MNGTLLFRAGICRLLRYGVHHSYFKPVGFDDEGEFWIIVKDDLPLFEAHLHGYAHLALITTDVIFYSGMEEFPCIS